VNKGFALLVLLVPAAAYAHPGELAPWTFNPWVLGGVALASALYVRGARAIGGAHRRLENAAFATAMLSLLVALISPLDAWSDYSFAAHMTQHELLMLLAAPLLVLARPLPAYLRALPGKMRASLAPRLASRRAQAWFRMLSAPALTLLVHGAIRWLWHLPSLFEAALANEWVHGVQHASFFLSALLFWWGLVQGRYGRAGYGLAFLFVLLTAMHTGALGALLAFSEHGWYPSYAARGGVRDVLADQQIAGQIMWVAAGVWMMMLALALLLAWLGEARRRAQRGSVARIGGAL
jgi:putative membrane protein